MRQDHRICHTLQHFADFFPDLPFDKDVPPWAELPLYIMEAACFSTAVFAIASNASDTLVPN